MAAIIAILSLAPALDGESVNNPNTGLAVIAVVSIVLGWVALAALWYFVFRGSSRVQQRERAADREQSRGGSDDGPCGPVRTPAPGGRERLRWERRSRRR
jgi:hypothetical protein